MNDTREFLTESLLKLSKNRNKRDFANYLKGFIFEYVFVANVEWVDDKKLKVYTDFLPFMDENISEAGVDKYFGFIADNMENIYIIDLNDNIETRKLCNKLNMRFSVLSREEVEGIVGKEVKNLAEVFKETISKGFNTDFEIEVNVNRAEVFTSETIEFLQSI